VGWSWNVRVALHSSELDALDMLSPMSWRVWTLGVVKNVTFCPTLACTTPI